MNYLAHAWTLGEGAAPELVLGVSLPDLAGVFDRRAPRLALDAAKRFEEAGEPLLARGVRAHHAADVCFHALPAFKEECAALRVALQPLAFESVRLFFLSHLLLEVLLDATLLERDPGLATRFYSSIEASPRTRVAQLVSSKDPAGFERWMDRFTKARFLLDYSTDDGVVFRTEQVLNRARQTMGGGGAKRLKEAMPGFRERVRSRVEVLTDEPRGAVTRLA